MSRQYFHPTPGHYGPANRSGNPNPTPGHYGPATRSGNPNPPPPCHRAAVSNHLKDVSPYFSRKYPQRSQFHEGIHSDNPGSKKVYTKQKRGDHRSIIRKFMDTQIHDKEKKKKRNHG